MKINKNDVKAIEDTCGSIRELYRSEKMSIAYVTLLGKAKEHTHRTMEEVYYIERGKGQLIVDGEIISLKKDDLIPIPQNSWHYLKNLGKKPLEIMVTNSPPFDRDDVIMKS
ncbi:MAG: cupin domain-containing protein [Candidatus Aenigmarchaeota archaeon]|nr:cupin domain-containing protein [Candidatus Aenigmarchaeota archaeon]